MIADIVRSSVYHQAGPFFYIECRRPLFPMASEWISGAVNHPKLCSAEVANWYLSERLVCGLLLGIISAYLDETV